MQSIFKNFGFTCTLILSLNTTTFAQKGGDKIPSSGKNEVIKIQPCNSNNIELSGGFLKESSAATSNHFIMEVQFTSTNTKLFTTCNFILDSIFFSSNRYVRANEISLLQNENAKDGLTKKIRYRIPKAFFTSPPTASRSINTFLLFHLGNTRCIKEVRLKLEDEII
jgi:hypothetical protein